MQQDSKKLRPETELPEKPPVDAYDPWEKAFETDLQGKKQVFDRYRGAGPVQ